MLLLRPVLPGDAGGSTMQVLCFSPFIFCPFSRGVLFLPVLGGDDAYVRGGLSRLAGGSKVTLHQTLQDQGVLRVLRG